MNSLISELNNVRNSPIKKVVDSRVKEFSNLGKKGDKEIFKELCFCLLTANFNAQGGIKIQEQINDGFLHLPEKEMANKLATLGHRFPNLRAKFILEARKHKDNIKQTLSSFPDQKAMRQWLADNIKGLGMKESSHFLRNIGYENVAILDFHIIDILTKHGIIERPKTLTPKKYLEIESALEKISEKTNLSLGELDLYLWYMETGKVLK